MFDGKTVLITGGAGSLGQALIGLLLKQPIKVLRVLDVDENGLFNLRQKFTDERMRFFLGDIRDPKRIRRAIEDVDIVYHAAALKHVELGELNPFEVLRTNIIGTQNMIEATLDEGKVTKFVFISSDKSVGGPVNIYGTSKFFGERLTITANNYKGDRPTAFGCVRLPNLRKSRGSVYEIWDQELAEGKPLSITSPEMERYFMSLEEAAEFTLEATEVMESGQIIVPANAERFKIIDLARQLSDKINIVGVRPGENISERMMTPEEERHAVRRGNLWVIGSA